MWVLLLAVMLLMYKAARGRTPQTPSGESSFYSLPLSSLVTMNNLMPKQFLHIKTTNLFCACSLSWQQTINAFITTASTIYFSELKAWVKIAGSSSWISCITGTKRWLVLWNKQFYLSPPAVSPPRLWLMTHSQTEAVWRNKGRSQAEIRESRI